MLSPESRYTDAAIRMFHNAVASGDPDVLETLGDRIRDTADRHTGPIAAALLNIACRCYDEAMTALYN